eukprot:gnl/TRDRNA2_/TRDRNA2_122737_c0_seq1.p1 gnl/TRDRNA2_/TRDRNA2_122737_c0~~gnl/TRDRNA2_/TRDRNA2_122737_c0_seq1.p1  ORF type:complete len:114 (+),score=10.19 gnl/TRDRNA2_/TRDRNA2_122737_c0_seq1:116-457(+)
MQGFDDRLSERDLYGSGIYFTTESCKAAQYCKRSSGRLCLVVARVLLGHPYLASEPMRGQRRPPLADLHGVPYDSVIARPGIVNGKPHRQVHWEFVVPDTQAYPELFIRVRLD